MTKRLCDNNRIFGPIFLLFTLCWWCCYVARSSFWIELKGNCTRRRAAGHLAIHLKDHWPLCMSSGLYYLLRDDLGIMLLNNNFILKTRCVDSIYYASSVFFIFFFYSSSSRNVTGDSSEWNSPLLSVAASFVCYRYIVPCLVCVYT